jgi:hypothetical protein
MTMDLVALFGLAMTVTRRFNLPEKGPGCWALASLLGGGFLPLLFRSWRFRHISQHGLSPFGAALGP